MNAQLRVCVRACPCVLLTAMDPEVLLQMVLVFEGLATLRAFELAVAGRLVKQLVLPDRQKQRRRRKRRKE